MKRITALLLLAALLLGLAACGRGKGRTAAELGQDIADAELALGEVFAEKAEEAGEVIQNTAGYVGDRVDESGFIGKVKGAASDVGDWFRGIFGGREAG